MSFKTIFPEATEQQIRQMNTYAELIVAWNQKINLVSRQDMERLWEHHILPSAIVLKAVSIPQDLWVLDIGSGGGFPAIPLKILRPDLQILMVDSIRKKKLFLQTVISQLKLENISVVNDRVEDLGRNPDYQEKFDLVSARAVATIDSLFNWGRPFLKKSGGYLLWKGTSDIPELEAASGDFDFDYRIFDVPDSFHTFSKKFSTLHFFEMYQSGQIVS